MSIYCKSSLCITSIHPRPRLDFRFISLYNHPEAGQFAVSIFGSLKAHTLFSVNVLKYGTAAKPADDIIPAKHIQKTGSAKMIIRVAKNDDYESICQVVQTAFAGAEHSDGNEHILVRALKNSDAFIEDLSLVAEIDNKIVGHIMFTKILIGECTEVALAPLSVLPEYQRHGIGTALIKEGHKRAEICGYSYSIVLGSDKYYPRMGYLPAKNFGIEAPFEVSDSNFMAYKLKKDAAPCRGVVKYAAEFGIN